MTYALLDDGFYDAPRFVGAPNECIGVWAKGLAYCNRHLTDGRIPARAARSFVEPVPGIDEHQTDPETMLRMMIHYGLWALKKDGFEHVGYLDHNPSKAEVLARRDAAKSRKDKWKTHSLERVPGTRSGTRSEHDLGTLPNPIRSDPIQSNKERDGASAPCAPADSESDGEETGVHSRPVNVNRGTRESDRPPPPAPAFIRAEGSTGYDLAKRVWEELWSAKYKRRYEYSGEIGPNSEDRILQRLGSKALEHGEQAEAHCQHWVRSYLKDHGSRNWLDEHCHPLRNCMRDLVSYGNPQQRPARPARNDDHPPKRVSGQAESKDASTGLLEPAMPRTKNLRPPSEAEREMLGGLMGKIGASGR